MNAADVLDKAADVIVERGWCQREYEGEDGRVCVVGAMGQVSHGKPWNDAYTALSTYLGTRHTALSYWNDVPGRTAGEVITALRSCAASLRATS